MCDLSDDINDIHKYHKIMTNNQNLDAVFGPIPGIPGIGKKSAQKILDIL